MPPWRFPGSDEEGAPSLPVPLAVGSSRSRPSGRPPAQMAPGRWMPARAPDAGQSGVSDHDGDSMTASSKSSPRSFLHTEGRNPAMPSPAQSPSVAPRGPGETAKFMGPGGALWPPPPTERAQVTLTLLFTQHPVLTCCPRSVPHQSTLPLPPPCSCPCGRVGVASQPGARSCGRRREAPVPSSRPWGPLL